MAEVKGLKISSDLGAAPASSTNGISGELNLTGFRQGFFDAHTQTKLTRDTTTNVERIVVTEIMIREAMADAPFQSQQTRGISLPKIQRFVDMLTGHSGIGEEPPHLKVDTDTSIIIEGNHRYVAGRICGIESKYDPYIGGNPSNIVPWDKIPIDKEDWG